ncbi:hypothetical protein JOC85_001175 [Bacillus mesophilus]|uniref:Uncharacterized protein n=1 Tax=Bacillus mesophilus TaxID=1808955 RepID=A0A6M0Q3Z8_9BACI|nr:hypothetical protein [Bacillus mesophilus]MBM7660408.1 hypothetical protein [Bacillus mesophilus]NEY71115.1 hypothetical protein [Bacillus mesophilus]
MFKLPRNNLNVEYKGQRIEDVATKIGSLFGEEGKRIGEKIDRATKKVTIKIED